MLIGGRPGATLSGCHVTCHVRCVRPLRFPRLNPDTVLDRPLDQRLARWLVRPFVATALHPNHLTLLSLMFGLSSGLLFALAGEAWAGLAATLFMLAVFTDHTDGELARLSGKCSAFGHNFDFVVGGINYTCLFVGLGIGLARGELGQLALLLGVLAGLCNPLITTLRMRLDTRFGKAAVAHPRMGPIEIEDIIYLIGPLAWWGKIKIFFLVFSLGTVGYLLWTVTQYVGWKRGGTQGGDDSHAG